MTTKQIDHHIFFSLRQQAEAIINARPQPDPTSLPKDWPQLTHELAVQQAMLELQHQQLEQAQNSEAAFFDSLPVGDVTLDAAGRITAINQAGAELLGQTRAQLLNQALPLLVSPEHQEAYRLFYQELTNCGTLQQTEIKLRKANGADFFARLLGQKEANSQRCRMIISDSLEQAQATQALHEAHDFIAAVLDIAGALITVVDRQGRLVRFNRACEQLSGYTLEQVKGRPFWDLLVPPEEREPVKALFEHLLAGHFPNQNENHWVTQTGSRRLIAWSNTALLDSVGAVKHVVGVGLDVTQSRELEETYRTLVNESVVGLVLVQGNRVVFANPALAQITGHPVAKLLTMSIQDAAGMMLPEDWAIMQARMQARQAGHPLPTGTEFRLLISTGEVRWIEAKSVHLNFMEQPTILVTLLDVTQRKLAEQALRDSEELHRTTIGSISDAVFITDDAGCFTYICPNAARIFGYSFQEIQNLGNVNRLLGHNIFDAAALAAAGELTNIERAITDRSGQPHILLVTVKQVQIKAGTLLYTCRDITERKQAELETARLLVETQEQQKRLRALTGQLAEAQEQERKALARELHDQVGQKLTALNLNLNALRSRLSGAGVVPEPVRAILDRSRQLVEETTVCVQDVTGNLRPQVLDDYGLVAALRWYAAELAIQTSLTITMHGTEPEPRLAAPVEHALFRIAQEALTNVIKHSHASQVTISLTKSNGLVRLIITDDGLGFDPAQRSKPGGRPGWGLLTMSERAETVGGNCHIESMPGAGTQITVEVPR